MKYWESLLVSQKRRGKSGLTIPFLIGSQMFLPDGKSIQDVTSLIFDIASGTSFETSLRICNDIDTLILEIRKPENRVYYPTLNGEPQRNLSVAIELKDKFGENIESLMTKLDDEFEHPIKHGLFSAKQPVERAIPHWVKFTDDQDVPFIKDAFRTLINKE